MQMRKQNLKYRLCFCSVYFLKQENAKSERSAGGDKGRDFGAGMMIPEPEFCCKKNGGSRYEYQCIEKSLTGCFLPFIDQSTAVYCQLSACHNRQDTKQNHKTKHFP